MRTVLSLLPEGGRLRVGSHLALTVLSVIARAIGAVLLVPLVSALFSEAPSNAWPSAGLLALVTLAGWVIDWRIAALGFELGFGLLDAGQRTVADRLARVRLSWFNAENTSTARQAIAATGPDLVGLVIYLFAPVLGAVLLPIVIGLALLPVAWPLGVAALAGVPVLLGAFWASDRLSRAADRAADQANRTLTARILEFARTQHALRAAKRVSPARSQAGAALDAQHGSMMRLILMQVPGQLLFSLASQAALLLLAGTTAVLAVRGDLSVPEAIALIVVIVRYLEPFTVLAELGGGIEASLTTLRRIGAVLAAPLAGAAASEAEGGSVPDSAAGLTVTESALPSAPRSAQRLAPAPHVRFERVDFQYDGDDQPVLSGFDLECAPGVTTAIVGPSGSGKSTILSLLAGLHDPSGGRILIDEVDAAELTPERRRELVSAVFQQPYLFDGSVRENVRAGHPTASDDAFRTAAALARVDRAIERLPDGWDAPVGEGGSSLSGGERQRVSIARALIKPAPLLLVDEATSALDTENEAAVAAALSEDPIPRTRIVVAHRLSSIRTADRVVFIDEGRIVEDGTIDELRAAGGRFARFWEHQERASGWTLS